MIQLQNSNISTINSTIQTINGNVSSLTSRVETLEENSSSSSSQDIALLQAQITLINNSILSINDTISSILTRLTAVEAQNGYDLLYDMLNSDENLNLGFTTGIKAGDNALINSMRNYNRLKIYAYLNAVPSQIDVKIQDTIKDNFTLTGITDTFSSFYFLKVKLTTAKTRIMVLKHSSFTFNSDGGFDFVQGTGHPDYYVYRIEGYDKNSV